MCLLLTEGCVTHPNPGPTLYLRWEKLYMLLHDRKKGGNINYNPVLARIALLPLYIFVCMYIFLPHIVYIQVSQIKQGSIKIGLCFACRTAITRTTAVCWENGQSTSCSTAMYFLSEIGDYLLERHYLEGGKSTNFIRVQVMSWLCMSNLASAPSRDWTPFMHDSAAAERNAMLGHCKPRTPGTSAEIGIWKYMLQLQRDGNEQQHSSAAADLCSATECSVWAQFGQKRKCTQITKKKKPVST